jgi:hypothetical protein
MDSSTTTEDGTTALSVERQTPFFAVSTHKFVVMSLTTFGLYTVYWVYRQWKRFVERGDVLSPFWRTFFMLVTNYALFARVRARAREDRVPIDWLPSILGSFYLTLTLTFRLPDPWWMLTLLSFLPIIPVQRTIDRVNAMHLPELPNRGYSGWNIFGIVVGGLLLILAVYGTLTGV